MGKPPGSVYTILRLNGGVWRPRRRRVGHLTLAEREAFSRGVAGGESRRAIAKRLGRAPSTVSRGDAQQGLHRHRAIDAHDRAWYRAWRPEPCLLETNEVLGQF